jgi:trimeric autotransporter adhesin
MVTHIVAAMGCVLAASAAHAQCQWTPGFVPPLETDLGLRALAVAEVAGNTDLYISGWISGKNLVMRWDGARWMQVGEEFSPWPARGLFSFDDGRGPALWAYAEFIGTEPAYGFARWDGSAWEPLGFSLSGRTIRALAAGHLAGRPHRELFAVTRSGGVHYWTEQGWDPLPWTLQGVNIMAGEATAIAAWDDGQSGHDQLYMAGFFRPQNLIQPARHIVRFDGATWMPIGTVTPASSSSFPLLKAAREPGSTQESLFLSGMNFREINGTPARNIARWDGAQWHPLGEGVLSHFNDLLNIDFPQSPGLVLAGYQWPQTVMRWTGSEFLPLGELMSGVPFGLALFEDASGNGELLFAGGTISAVGGRPLSGVGRWDGRRWAPVTSGLDGPVRSIVPDPLDPERVIAAGDYLHAAEQPVRRVAAWDGYSWVPLGEGMNSGVYAMAAATTQPLGPALYAGGAFTSIIHSPAQRIARWDGHEWSSLAGGGMNDVIYTLALFGEDGSGERLFAGGWFTEAGASAGQTARHIARWDGETWSEVGGGVGLAVRALAVFDPDGAGPAPAALYAGGHFTSAGGAPAKHIARWDGQAWSALGSGLTGPSGSPRVYALHVFDAGQGPVLFVGGEFAAAGGIAATNIAGWDGLAWTSLSTGTDGRVLSMGVHDSGRGPELHIGGEFSIAGGVSAERLAAWNGSRWRSVEGGADGAILAIESAELTARPPALFLGGDFVSVGRDNLPSHHFAVLTCPEIGCYANCDGSTAMPILNIDDFTCFINEFGAAQSLPHLQQVEHYANCDQSMIAPVLNIDDFSCFINLFAQGCL